MKIQTGIYRSAGFSEVNNMYKDTMKAILTVLLQTALLVLPFVKGVPAQRSMNIDRSASNSDDVGRNSVVFEQNNGQFDPNVLYLARTGPTSMFLTASEAVYVLPMSTDATDSDRLSSTAYALRMRFADAGRNITARGVANAEQRTNYFRGSAAENWRTQVPSFSSIELGNVADGISMLWHGQENGATRYDLVVDPGADPSQIVLSFDGADTIEIDENGGILINTPAGTIRQAAPFAYQEGVDRQKNEIRSGFRVEGRSVRFDLGEYDTTRPLVIDPTVTLSNLAFSTLIGSFGDEFANDNAVDAMGNIYVTGRTTSVSFPTTAGTFDTTSNGTEDVFVTKLNPSGTGIVFSTYLGGNFFDEGRGIAVDTSGNIFVTGTASNFFPMTAGSFDTTFGGGSDVFVTKLNSTGSALLYSTYIGESAIDYANDLAIDTAGNAYIVVRTSDTVVDYPTTPGAFDTTFNGIDDVAVSKLNTTGSGLVYSTFLGGSSIDNGTAIAVNAAGEAYVAGSTTDDGTDLQTTAGAYDTTHNGVTDFFVTRFSADGSSLIYSTFIGGSGIDNAMGLAIDGAGSAYVVGTSSVGFPVTAGVIDTTALGSSEIGASKLSPDGATLQYSTFIGGNQGESANSVAVDLAGNAYITGSNFGGDFPVTSGAFDTTFNGGNDVILTVLNPAATGYLFSTYLGGGGNDSGNDIALDASGNVYVAGQTSNNATLFPTTPEAFQTFHGGGTDALIAKLGDYSIAGRVIDASGTPLANVMVALSGQVAANVLTGADGRFGFTNTVPGEPHSVTATRTGYSMNPSVFNIASLANNRELVFVGTAGSPSGGAGGTLLFENLTYNRSENAASLSVTVIRTGIVSSASPVTVDYSTADGSAVSGIDFHPTVGTLTFGPFETAKTITISLVNDAVLEPRETFSLIISNPTNNADIEPGRNSATIALLDDDIKSGSLLISEFRERGRLGANDEYIKLFNPNDFDLTINAADGSPGITLARTAGSTATPIVTIPNLVTIRSRGHYLLTNNNPIGGFSLIDFPTGIGTLTGVGDQTFSADIPDNAGLVLLNTADQMQFTRSNSVDSVGFGDSPWAEGRSLTTVSSADFESCFVRRIRPGELQDSGDNFSDFQLLDNRSRTFTAQDTSKVYSALGVPAPETSESLRLMKPNEVSVTETGTESFDPTPIPNGVAGVLTVYRRITNLTTAPITALRLRAIEFPTPGSQSQRRTSSRPDLRLTSSDDTENILGLTLEGSRLQPNGGGLNSTLSVASVSEVSPLMPGHSIVVAVRFGVMRWGRHPFVTAVEAK